MANNDLILIEELCIHYEVSITFFNDLEHIGLIELLKVENTIFIHHDKISDLEKMIRLYKDLNVNLEGIDIIFNLLKNEDNLRKELTMIKNRLKLYESE